MLYALQTMVGWGGWAVLKVRSGPASDGYRDWTGPGDRFRARFAFVDRTKSSESVSIEIAERPR